MGLDGHSSPQCEQELVDPLVNTQELVDPLANTRELVDPLVNTPPSERVFKAVRCHVDNSRDVGLLGPPSSWSAWTWIVVRLRVIKCFKWVCCFKCFNTQLPWHFSSFLLFFFNKSQLICSSPPSGQGCELQSVKMTDGPLIFPSPFLKNGQWQKIFG